jgi:glycolate oxidase iron-sulfur subunit
MDNINELERPVETDYLNCIRCGLCLSVCPTYREYLNETASPRGRVALTRKGLEGQLDISPNLMEQMYSCFACMACNEVCPVGIRPADLTLAMRFVQEQRQPAGWKKTLFEGLIPHPDRMEAATFPLRIYEGSGLRRLVYALGLMRFLPKKLRDLEAMLPRLPQRPLRRILPNMTKARGETKYQVGFFLGCAQSLMFADESKATVNVLSRNGCSIYTPKDVECCGMPAHGYGRLDLVRKQAKHNIAIFERQKLDVVVTDCATCGSTLKEYGSYLKDDPKWAERAKAFSAKVRDVSEFLGEIPLEKPKGKVNARVTYHDPCHLRRAQKVWKQPRDILKMIDGLEYIEMSEADWCCGSAGSQLITHYETSLQVLDRKMDNLKATNAQVVASGCPGCQMQLNTGIKRRGMDMKVVHPITLLNEAYEASDE